MNARDIKIKGEAHVDGFSCGLAGKPADVPRNFRSFSVEWLYSYDEGLRFSKQSKVLNLMEANDVR